MCGSFRGSALRVVALLLARKAVENPRHHEAPQLIAASAQSVRQMGGEKGFRVGKYGGRETDRAHGHINVSASTRLHVCLQPESVDDCTRTE